MRIMKYFAVLLIFVTAPNVVAGVLLENFDTNRTLSAGAGSFGRVTAGRTCCPFQLEQNFREELAQSLRLKRSAIVTAFELVLYQFSGNVDSLEVALTRSSSNNPGGTAKELDYMAPDLDQILETWLLEDLIPRERALISIPSVVQPRLSADEMYWIVLRPGKDVAPGEFIEIAWWTGDIPQGASSTYAKRNNSRSKGPIEEQRWTTGRGQMLPHQSGYTLRVLGEPMSISGPGSLASVMIGLVGILLFVFAGRLINLG